VASEGGLAAYLDRDLRKLGPAEQEKFSQALRELVKPEAKNPEEADFFEAWFVKRFRSGKARWIFLEAYPGYEVPDVSAVRVHLFDEAWNEILVEAYPTGYRFFLAEARVEESGPLKQDLLVVRVTSSGPFRVLASGQKKSALEPGDFQEQHYAFTGDRMALVRLEDDQGQLIANSYCWETPMKGGAVPERTQDEWIEALASGLTVEQLAALVWLSGSHLDSSEPRQENVNQQAIEDSRLHEDVRDSDRTRTAIRKLRKHDAEWVRAYADLVEASRDPDG